MEIARKETIRRTERHFYGAQGQTLFRRAWIPDRVDRVLLLVHGLGEHSGRYEEFGSWFARHGFAVHAYDQQGHGRSIGRRGHASRFRHFVDDLEVVRVGVRQRLQTKRGAPGRKRIQDWMALDVWTSFFPDADRDNAGETLGLVEYDYEWHLGGRTSFLTSGAWEPWTRSLDYVSVAMQFDRPGRGSFNVRHTWLNAAGSSILTTSWNYGLNEKWSVYMGQQVDFDENEQLSSSIILSRTGRDWLWQFGVSFSHTQDETFLFVQVSPVMFPNVGFGAQFRQSSGTNDGNSNNSNDSGFLQ